MIRNGTIVMLIGTDGYTPPFGAVGEVVGFDDGDYEVLFERHPCPVGDEITWFCAPSWLMFIYPSGISSMAERLISNQSMEVRFHHSAPPL